MNERSLELLMKQNQKKSYEKDALRLEYLLKRRELELDAVRGELKGEREVNSLCAAFIIYLISKLGWLSGDDLVAEIKKAEVNKVVGNYFASCDDNGDSYRVILNPREVTNASNGS